MNVEFHFDFSCPYAYVGSEVIESTCARIGAALSWRPMLLGGVFRAIGEGDGPMAKQPAAKAAYIRADALRWAARRGVPLRFPEAHPMRTVRALRVLLGLPEELWPAAIHAIYRAYWQAGDDITRDEVIDAALGQARIPAHLRALAFESADSEAIKAALRRRTDEAVARGVFGAPTIFADGVMLWGQDRLHFLEALAEGWRIDEARPPERVCDFWFDLSSPYAYLASTRIEALCAAAGARLVWRPLLLGGLFKQIGTADVPLLGFSESKRRYHFAEMDRWARWWGVPFRMATRFPMRTVAALRLIVLAARQGDPAPLIHRLFRGLWVEDVDLADDATLRRLCGEVGLDPGLVDRTGEPDVKQALIDATTEAKERGVFGVPTCVVGGELYWGQDRLELVADALRRA
jgi:2-hydroxychromene-2-carboxylate isomerase